MESCEGRNSRGESPQLTLAIYSTHPRQMLLLFLFIIVLYDTGSVDPKILKSQLASQVDGILNRTWNWLGNRRPLPTCSDAYVVSCQDCWPDRHQTLAPNITQCNVLKVLGIIGSGDTFFPLKFPDIDEAKVVRKMANRRSIFLTFATEICTAVRFPTRGEPSFE
jgi:hypothetical protein